MYFNNLKEYLFYPQLDYVYIVQNLLVQIIQPEYFKKWME